VEQTYDHSGNRAIKRLISVAEGTGTNNRKLVRDTVYADERLTIAREVGQKPEALFHIFSGPARVASKWIGGDGIFTYHAQLPTRTVSDVVYARGDDPTTARIHQQMEYVAFGDLVVGREMIISEGSRDLTNKSRLDRPLYRFDAKEFDEETNLTYFGARHYDQRLGLWLSPDPAFGGYLSGEGNGGIFGAEESGCLRLWLGQSHFKL
jgi:RHS repeat-associated protein